MRISDWSSDVCSSDLRAYACVGSEAGAFVPWRQQPARAQRCIVALALQQRGHDLVAQQRVVALRLTVAAARVVAVRRSEEHTSELQSLMRISYAVFCLKKKKTTTT